MPNTINRFPSRSIPTLIRAGVSVAIVAVLAVAALGRASAAEPGQDDRRTLNGNYYWTDGSTRGALKAVFTQTGEQTWDVEFRFRFRDRPHTYTGVAEGSLGDGELSGTVKNESKRRTFTFRGEFENGRFEGDHFEGRHRTGTLTLK